MLYKNFESGPFLYEVASEGGTCNPKRWEYVEGMVYGETITDGGNSGVLGSWVNLTSGDSSNVQINSMIRIRPRCGNDYYATVCWDAVTGDLLWKDTDTINEAFGWSGLYGPQGMWSYSCFTDDVGRMWARRQPNYFDPRSELVRYELIENPVSNSPAGQIGMPDLRNVDIQIHECDWLIEDGSEQAICENNNGYKWPNVFAVSWTGGWVLTSMYVQGILPGMEYGWNYVIIHSLSSKRRLGYIRVNGSPIGGIAVSNSTAYLFCSNGTFEVVNVPAMLSTGVLQYSSRNLASGASFSFGTAQFSATYDPFRKRLLVFEIVPDELVTGRCLSRWEGFAPKQVPTGVTKPLPLTYPREGRQVKVLARAYGEMGQGVGGDSLSISVNEEAGAVSPTISAADESGFVRAVWNCTQSGIDNAVLTATLDADQTISGLEPGGYRPTALAAPGQVQLQGQEDLFFPGWWLSSRSQTKTRSQTLEQILDPYLSYFDDSETNPDALINNFNGVLMEYSWYELETSIGAVDLSKVWADLNYLRTRGMKMIIGVRTVSYTTDASIWIPNYIVNDDYNDYEDSGTILGANGVWATCPENPAGQYNVYAPMWFDPEVRTRFIAFMIELMGEFADEDDVVGFIPLDAPKYTGNAVKNAVLYQPSKYSEQDYLDGRKTLLETINGLNPKMVFENVLTGGTYQETITNLGTWSGVCVADAYLEYCKSIGVHLFCPYWYAYDFNRMLNTTGSKMTSRGSAVATGVQVPAWVWEHSQLAIDCYGELPAPQELLLRSTNVNCDHHRAVDDFSPWMVFCELTANTWSGEQGVWYTGSLKRLTKHTAYYV